MITEQEFIDYIAPYGTHVQFVYGDDILQKKIHLTPHNSNYNHFPHITSNGEKYHMEFEINDKPASIKECAQLLTSYKRNSKLEELGL
jgi:hypothetical protein